MKLHMTKNPIDGPGEREGFRPVYFARAAVLAVCILFTAGMILPVPVDPSLVQSLTGFDSMGSQVT